jgi:uncharacterized membrane protein (DUF373 family)
MNIKYLNQDYLTLFKNYFLKFLKLFLLINLYNKFIIYVFANKNHSVSGSTQIQI